MKRLEWAKRIVELREGGKKRPKFREIANILEEEFEKSAEPGIFTEDYVKILYKRYKDRFSIK